MRAFIRAIIVSTVCFSALAATSAPVLAQDSTDARLKALEERIQAQDAEIQRLKGEVSAQAAATADIGSEIDSYLSKEGDGSFLAQDGTLRPFFNPGLRFYSADKAFQLRVGGRIMLDAAFMDADRDLEDAFGKDEFDNLYEFRRARLFMEGTIYENVHYKAQYDFAGQEVEFKDMYINVDADFAEFKIGNFKEPFSLEELTSSKYITFMERGLPNVFAPSRSVGLQIHGEAVEKKLNWRAGWFWGPAPEGMIDSAFTARIAFAPIFENKGEELLHFGAAISIRDPDSKEVRYRQRPEVHTTTRLVDTGTIMDVKGITLVGLEAAYVTGPFSAQAEVMWASVDSKAAGDPTYMGFYVYVSYWLTGEHRVYKDGEFDRVKPKENFGNGGSGAWEVRARYSYLDLNDGDVDGGELSDFTLGVNWHLNPATRVMLEYVFANVKDGALDANLGALQLRFQVDF